MLKDGSGCGCIVEHENSFFIGTAAHLALGSKKNNFFCIKKNVFKGKEMSVKLPHEKKWINVSIANSIFFKTKKGYADFMLIPIDKNIISNQKTFGFISKISNQELNLFNKLKGVSRRRKRNVALSGIVVEKKNSHQYLTDLGGAKGFSGTCYFYNGLLSADHTGSGEFVHEENYNDKDDDFDDYDNYNEDEDDINLDDIKTIEKNYMKYQKEFFKSLSRNPRTKVTDTSIVFKKKNHVHFQLLYKQLPKCK